MPGLVDKVNKTLVRKDGKLVEQVTPTSQLAGQAGMTAPPTTPAGVGALGGTAKQQDMAGSVAQKTSALRQSLDSVTSLNEAQADKRYRSATTADEQGQLDKQKRLGEVFGGTQKRVQDLIGAAMSQQVAPAAPVLNTANLIRMDQPNQQAEVNEAFAAIVAGTDIQYNINRIQALTGQTPDQITATANQAATDQIAKSTGTAAAGAVTDAAKVNVSALLPSLGTSREELASLLGLDPAAIDNLSLDDLDTAVRATTSQGPGLSVAETQAASQNASLGSAERAAMREASKEQSTTGLASSEAQLESLGRSLENADQVQFGGKQYTVEELLSDENISKVVSDYLTNPESPQSKALEADPNSVGLREFIRKYRGALTDAVQQIGTATTKAEEVQNVNASLANAGNYKIPDAIMGAVYGGSWSPSQTTEMAPTGIVASLKSLNPQQLELTVPLMDAASRDPGLANEIKNFTADQLRTFTTPGANGISPFKQLQDNKALKLSVQTNKGNIDELLSSYFGQPLTQTGTGSGSWGSVGDAQRTALGLDLKHVMQAAGAKPQANGKYSFEDTQKLYAGGLRKLLFNKIMDSLKQADEAKELVAGNTGWKPRSTVV